MAIAVQCDGCKKNLNVPDNMAGKRGKCPACGQVLSIPALQAAASAPAAAAAPQAPAPQAPAPAAAESAPAAPPPPSAPPPPGGDDLPPDVAANLPVFLTGGVTGVYPADTFEKLFLVLAGLSAGGVLLQLLTQILIQINILLALQAVVAGLATLLCIALIVVFILFLYHAWNLIQDGEVRAAPPKATLLSVLPFINFIYLPGLCEDLNRYAETKGIQARRADAKFMTIGLAVSYGAALVMFLSALLGLLVMVGGTAILLLAMNSVKDTVVDIIRSKGG
ncbi:MAG: hypothetical protein AB7K24_21245 [Gemmataceae bacterium]